MSQNHYLNHILDVHPFESYIGQNSVIFMENPVIFRKNSVIFRTNPVIFRKNPVVYRINTVISRKNPVSQSVQRQSRGRPDTVRDSPETV